MKKPNFFSDGKHNLLMNKIEWKHQLPSDRPPRGKLIKDIDDIFSLYIRYRDNWTCKRCGRVHSECDKNLHNSHFFSRDDMGTRWDLKNCDSACGLVIKIKSGKSQLVSCHGIWEKTKNSEYEQFKREQLGDETYERLKMMAMSTYKIDVAQLIILKEFWRKRLLVEISRFRKESNRFEG